VRAQTAGWEVELQEADYDLDTGVLAGQLARLMGHGFEIEAEEIRILTQEDRVQLKGAHVVPYP